MDYMITGKGVIPANLHLVDSYEVKKRDFADTLNSIKEEQPDSEVWNRGIPQMCLEIACHNACYGLGLWKDRTKDCDLDYPQSFWERAIYAVVGVLVWIFIP